VRSEWLVVSLNSGEAASRLAEIGTKMSKSTTGSLAGVAAGVLLVGVAGALAFGTSTGSMQGLISVIQRQWADLFVAIGLVGYAAAIFVAAFGKRRPRHVNS
jgi:hypothetical protein